MKSLDLFIGIKAEQSLRDLVRNLSESSTEESFGLELYPMGKKDWIAGARVPAASTFADVRTQQTEVGRLLMSVGSHQRIRQDGLRIYAVHPPVPVFREAMEDSASVSASPSIDEETGAAICPNCGAEVHRFNLLFGPGEKVVGCYLCRGEQR